MGKAKDFLKVTGAAAFIIALLSVSYVGINHLALRAATGRTETLPQHTVSFNLPELMQNTDDDVAEGGILYEIWDAPVEYSVSEELNAQHEQSSEGFVMPSLVIFENRRSEQWSSEVREKPPYALSMDEAAFIGAYYIWDVLGINIEGMYVQMHFINNTRTGLFWYGPIAPFIDSSFTGMHWFGLVSRNMRASYLSPGLAAAEYGHYWVLMFAIDAINGERTMLWYLDQFLVSPMEQIQKHRNNMSLVAEATGWRNMNLDERKEKLGLTPGRLAAYTQSAKEVARRHFAGRYFDESVIVEISFVEHSRLPLVYDGAINEYGEFVFVPIKLRFEVVDNTGRAAIIVYPIESTHRLRPGIFVLTLL